MTLLGINWADPAIVSSAIQAGGAIVVAIIAGLIGRQLANRKKLQEKLVLAVQDIAFLLEVEEAHTKRNMEAGGVSFKLRMREIARKQGYTWSGKFTPSRADNSPTIQEAKKSVAQAAA